MFLASQLNEISSRFPAHVQEIREFLLKEKLPVPSPDAIPQLSSRLEADPRFRADVASLMRATLYQEREEIGYEELLGILVAATAGTEHDLKSDSQETDIREMLRFLLQSRRTTFHPEPESEEAGAAVEPEPREPVPVEPVPVMESEPVLVGALRSPAEPGRWEPRFSAASVGVAEAERHEDDLVLPSLFRSTGVFAAQMELDPPQRVHSAWIVGMICLLLGVGAGLMIHRVVPAAGSQSGAADIGVMVHRLVSVVQGHAGVHAADISPSKPEAVSPAAPQESTASESSAPVPLKNSPASSGQPDQKASATGVAAEKTEPPAGAVQTASVAEGGGTTAQPATSDNAGSVVPATAVQAGSTVPVTVVKQVVTAFPSQSLDSNDPTPQSAAATKSIVSRASAGIMPANVIFSPAPKYPAAASAARVQGEVTVRAVVDPQGKVIYAHAVSGPAELRDAATEAVQRWRYRPLLYNGKPIAVTTVAILDFKVAE